jgi:signal transduction histidine kinase/CheY-like chemotaxis protein
MLLVFLSFAVMVTAGCVYMNQVVLSEIAVAAREMLAKTEVGAYSMLNELEISMLSVSIGIQDGLDSGESDEWIESYMKNFSRDMFSRGGETGEHVIIGGFIRGRMTTSNGAAPPPGYEPEERPWYRAARAERGGTAFAGPYTDAFIGESVVTFSKKLTGKNGENYGVVFFGVSRNVLWEAISSMRFENGGYGMIVGADGSVIVHPEKDLAGRPLSVISEGYAGVAERIKMGEGNIEAERVSNFFGNRVISFFRNTPNGWYVGVALPESGYYGDVYRMTAVLAALGAVLAILLNILLLRLSMAKISSDAKSADKSLFLARMSHEIRTPLNSILGMSELTMRRDIPKEVFEYISIIRQSSRNLLSIVNDILDFSKIEAGRLVTEHEEYYPASLLNDVVNVIRVRLIGKPVTLFVKVDSNIPDRLIGDEARVRQILINILSNAVKYTGEGYISFSAMMEKAEDGNVRLIFRVGDSGIGIRESDLGMLFQEFTRVETTNGRNEVEGTGLGLVISRSLCRAMGGDISVTSEYGKGSVFEAAIVQESGSGTKLASVGDASKKSVLIFENRPAYFDALAYALSDLGVSYERAGDPVEFKNRLVSGVCDFAFTPSSYAADCAFALCSGKSPTVLISMEEFGDDSFRGDIHRLTMPIYCIAVADILNDPSAKQSYRQLGYSYVDRKYFSAPDISVLIVDDISTNLRVAAELMKPYGMNIDTCMSGAEAILLVRENRYDIIFMDHMMNPMDGVEATGVIRSSDGGDPYYRDVPIIALTANAISEQREMLLRSGMNDFLAKPIEISKLDALLRKWIPEDRRKEAEDADWNRESEMNEIFRKIKGINVDIGLRNSGGSPAVYADILAEFCRDADERAERIANCMEDDDMDLYMTLVHALKGASGAVGASEFAEFAARMEGAAQKGDAVTVANMTDGLLAELRGLTDEIRAALDGCFGGADAPAPGRLSAVHLKKLESALADMDISTVNELMMEYTGIQLDPNTRRELSEIEKQILLFEYDAATELINRLIDAISE